MDHKEKLHRMHKRSVKKVDEYITTKGKLKKAQHQKLHTAKSEWDAAWNKMMEAMLVLERLEI